MSATFKPLFNKTILYITGDRGKTVGNSHKNLFGENSPRTVPQSTKNRIPSNIPIGSTGNDVADSNGNLRENGYGSEKSN